MSEEGKDELRPEVRDLVDRAAEPEPAPEEARDEVWGQLEESVLDGAAESIGNGEVGAEGDAAGADGAAESAAETGTDAASGAGGLTESIPTGEAATGLGKLLVGGNLAQTVLAFVVGTGVGAGGYAALQSPTEPSPSEQTVAVAVDTGTRDTGPDAGPDTGDADVSRDTADGQGDTSEVRERDTADDTVSPSARAPERETDSSKDEPDKPRAQGRESTLSQERLLLSQAQAAIARGRPDAALEALAKHREQFPKGALVEERRALEVRAHLRAGETKQARTKAEAFVDEYPQSIFSDIVEPALEAKPDAQP